MIQNKKMLRWLPTIILSISLLYLSTSLAPARAADDQPAEPLSDINQVTDQTEAPEPIPNDPIIGDIQTLLEAVGEYRFTAEVEQTLIPRPLPANIGKSEERYDSQIKGDVVLPDFLAMDLRFESSTNLPPIKLEQDGNDTYLIEGEERTLVENPLGATLPSGSGDIIGYLYAAENIRQIENPDQPSFTIYTFDINGETYADYVVRTVRENLPDNEKGQVINPSPILQGMTGTGELWIDADGVPRRQILSTSVPNVNELYDSKSETVITFGYDNGLLEEALAQIEASQSSLFSSASLFPTFDFGSDSAGVPVSEINRAETASYLLTFILAGAILLGLVFAVLRQRRWVQVFIPLTLALAMFASPILTPLAYAAQHSARPVAVSLAEALGVESSSDDKEDGQAEPEQFESNEPYIPEIAPEEQLQQTDSGINEEQCGFGNKVDDSDRDGLTDFVERCLGTGLFLLDTDRDLLTDTLEVEGFMLGGQRWYSNPLQPDSNNDGLLDNEEWPAPIGLAPSHDIDGDGLPNIWDHDNDGDGIVDEIDFDPFTASDYKSKFTLESTLDEDDFNGYQFIEFQVQPAAVERLRYTTTPLDWPNDTEGNLQDHDHSKEDIQLVPALKVRTTTPPSEEVREAFGLGAINVDAPGWWAYEEGDRYDMYIVLSPINDGGKIVAFEGRAVYGPDDLAAIDWESIEMVWTTTMMNDFLNEEDEIETDELIVAEYVESSFRITGLSLTKSGAGDFAIFGTPSTPDSNRDLFQLLFGLESSYLAAISPDLDDLVGRFSDPNTPIEETWGLTPSSVAAVGATATVNNADELIVESGSALNTFLNDNYAKTTDKMVSAVLATEYEAGYSTMEDIYTSGSDSFSFNLANIPESTFRTVNMVNFEYDGTSWSSLDQGQINRYLLERYEDLSPQVEALGDLYPTLNQIDLYLIVMGFTTIWTFSNQNTMIQYDGVDLVPENSDDSSIHQNLSNDGLDQISDTATYLGESQKLFKVTQDIFWKQKLSWDSVTSGVGTTFSFVYSMYSLGSSTTYATVKYGLTWAEDADFYGKVLGKIVTRVSSSADEAGTSIGSAILRNKAMIGKVLKGVFVVLSILATAYEIYSIWSARGEFSSIYDYEESYATSYAITATVLAVIFLLISFTVVGAVLVAALAIASLLVFLISRAAGDDGFDFNAEFAEFITELFHSVDAYTRLLTFDFEGLDLEFSDAFVTGSSVLLEDEFIGVLTRERGSDNSQLNKSDIYGYFEITDDGKAFSDTYNYDHSTYRTQGDAGSRCEIGTYIQRGDANAENEEDRYTWGYQNSLICRNEMAAEFTFNTPSPNIPIEFIYSVYADTRYEECKAFRDPRCRNKTENLDLPNELDSDDKWDSTTLYFDIIPNTVNGLWNWNQITNHDPDGDGLDAAEESAWGTSTTLWDTDGDGLSDDFEADTYDTFGADPADPDTDDDGLTDGEEFRAGTSINDPDTDDDGLLDGEEVLSYDSNTDTWSGGGWMIDIDGTDYWAFTVPFAADYDRDGILDGSEKANGTAPAGINDAPQIFIDGSLRTSPTGNKGIYVKSGTPFTASVSINNIGTAAIDQVVELCLPSTVTGVQVNASGDRVPTTTPNGDCYEWDFSTNNLELFQTFSVDISGQGGTTTSNDEIIFTVPYQINDSVKPISLMISYVEDNTPPTVALTSPSADDQLSGDYYVMGGYAADPHSWVETVQVTAPTPGGNVVQNAVGTANWAYTWELPNDGVVAPSVVAIDAVGNVSTADSASVTVDSLGPAITINIADNQTIASTEAMDTTFALSGTVTDNFAGISYILLQVNDRPWQKIWSYDEITPTLSANWSGDWNIHSLSKAQGEHKLRLLAYDQFNNTTLLERTVLVDVLPPTSELTNRNFTGANPPHVAINQPLDLFGVANDAGNNPAAPGPVALEGNMNSIEDSTVWLQLDRASDNDEGVTVSWVGDVNGDRFGDLAIGLPAAGDGDGLVSIVLGKAGDWANPKLGEVEELIANRPSYVGDFKAGIGKHIQPAGDFNGDGIDDMLIGDLTNNRIYLVFGVPSGNVYYRPLIPDDTFEYVEFFLLADGESVTKNFSSAGDINGDGLADLLISTTSATGGKVYLVLGDASYDQDQPLDSYGAAIIETSSAGAAVAAVGDANGDFNDDFAVAFGGAVHLFAGGGSYAERGLTPISTSSAIGLFATGDLLPTIVGNGDMNNDGIGDFAFSNGSSPTVVFGSNSNSFSITSLSGFPSTLTGYLAGVGDVNKDGLSDLLVGNVAGDAYLIHGNRFNTVAATIEGVESAANAPYVAGADLVGDGSSDLLVVPSSDLADQFGFNSRSLASVPLINASMLSSVSPDATTLGTVSTASKSQPLQLNRALAATNVVTGDITVGQGVGYDYSTIQAAIDDVTAERILIDPGTYIETLVLRDNIELIGLSGNPDDNILTFPNGGTNILIDATGVTNASVSGLTLVGSGSNTDIGLKVAGNTEDLFLTGNILRDLGTAISQDGVNANLAVVSNTIVDNVAGLSAINCAKIVVRNTIFAFNTGTALTYQNCATVKNHTYNLFHSNGTDLSPSGASTGEIFLDPLFEDSANDDFRIDTNSPAVDAGDPNDLVPVSGGAVIDIGYYEQPDTISLVGDVTVGPSSTADYSSIQAAIDDLSAARVLVEPGIYVETLTLRDGVKVIGSGADRTFITLPDNSGESILVDMAGANHTSLINFSLVGDGAVTGVSVTGSTDNLTLARNIIRDTGTAVLLDGSGVDIEIRNNTIVGNVNGIVAVNGASIDVDNTILAYNSGTGLNYDVSAMIKRHEYNLFWANGTDQTPVDPGSGERFSDPLFIDFGNNDFRVTPLSPVIDAGAPGDAIPAGAGEEADIGHLEQTGTSFFADDDYCGTCENDGLVWGVDAFARVSDAVDAAIETRNSLFSNEPVVFSVGVGAGTYTETVEIQGSLKLLGSGPAVTKIIGDDAPAIVANGAMSMTVSGFYLQGIGTDPVAVELRNGSSLVDINRNLIRTGEFGTNIFVHERSSGMVDFNTIVDGEIGIDVVDQYSWLIVRNNIIHDNIVGMQAGGESSNLSDGVATIYNDFNLLFNIVNIVNEDNVITGTNNIIRQDPLLDSNYFLTADSPAVDRAEPEAEVPVGGGFRADIGFHELKATPITVLMGQPDDSVGTENIGVGGIEFAIVSVGSITSPVTSTLPSSWTSGTLLDPNQKVTYWDGAYTPTAEGYYRIYSRASDSLGNTEIDETEWFDGAFVVDNGVPTVTLSMKPFNNPWIDLNWARLIAEVTDYASGNSFDIDEYYFEVDGERVEGRWRIEEWEADGVTPRSFYYLYQFPTKQSPPTDVSFQAFALDGAGNLGQSTVLTKTFDTGVQLPKDRNAPAFLDPNGVYWGRMVSSVQSTNVNPRPYNEIVTGTVTFEGLAHDASGIQGYSLSFGWRANVGSG